jgi:hypothetical protein
VLSQAVTLKTGMAAAQNQWSSVRQTYITSINSLIETAEGRETVLWFELINGGTSYRVGGFPDKTKGVVNIPATYRGKPVTSIGAFSRCASLTSITIPNSVTSIDYNAFEGCTSLTGITVAANNPSYASEGGILFNKAKTDIIAVPKGISGTVTIPNSVTSIGSWAFEDCTSLASITIPASVTSIGNYAFNGWTSSQTINVRGYASQAAADSAWGSGWRQEYVSRYNIRDISATIKYWNGSSYQ